MPEGPEIRRAADKLEAAVAGKPLTHVWFAFPELKPFEAQLTGARVERFETRGKALLTHFSCGLTLYSHNQLYGVWRVVKAGETPQTTRSLRVRLETEDAAVLLYSASEIEMLDADGVAAHAFLQRVGPDVLDMSLTVEQVKERLLSPRFHRRQFSGLLLDQAFLAGLGNYLRVEILWQAQLAPRHKAIELSNTQLDALASACLEIPGCLMKRAGRWMRISITARCFASRCFTAPGRNAAAAGELSRRRRCRHGRFTGVRGVRRRGCVGQGNGGCALLTRPT
uniref:endonuclease VIII n=1 Tax=Cronobacter malonaticus TaxID=413503 RepID=UPI003F7AF015